MNSDTKITDDIIREKLISTTMDNPVHKYIGLEILELKNGYGRARVKFSENICNPYGFVHGGILMTLVDATAGITACMSGNYVTTVNATINFLLPAIDTEYIYCECECLRSGKHLIVMDIRITDDGSNVLDSGEYTYFITDEKVL